MELRAQKHRGHFHQALVHLFVQPVLDLLLELSFFLAVLDQVPLVHGDDDRSLLVLRDLPRDAELAHARRRKRVQPVRVGVDAEDDLEAMKNPRLCFRFRFSR